VKYLLDVNALVALGFDNHEFHARVAAWVKAQEPVEFVTCSITELGFLRVLSQVPGYDFSIVQARTLLTRLKQSRSARFSFLQDDHDITHLPAWVKAPKQITDGHLAQLARSKGAVLATLDARIPGAYLISNP
jgi:uncharacterized protein